MPSRDTSNGTVSFSYDNQSFSTSYSSGAENINATPTTTPSEYVDSTKEGDIPKDKATTPPVQKEADKETIEEDFYTLTGTLSVVPSKKLHKIKTGESVSIEGLGIYLSGDYLVECRNITLSADSGFSYSLDLLKTGFTGNSLKGTMKVSEG